MSLPSSGADPVRVLVADSARMQSQLLAGALRRRPEFTVTSCGLDGDALLKVLHSTPIDVVLFSIDHENDSGRDLAAVRRVHLDNPEIACIVLLQSYDKDLVIDVFRSGAKGLFSASETPFRALCKCIHRVHNGQVWASSRQLRYLLEAFTHVPTLRVVNAQGNGLLTDREEQVVALVADGLTNREIAQELGLSAHTIKKYLFRVFDKLGISSRVELVLYAVSHGESRHSEWLAAGSQIAPTPQS
jgi:DNA-binding NarL/FixJ family response regulator